MEKDVKLNQNNHIVKANKLIEAKGRLSLLEQKLFASLISEIQPEDEDFKTYHLKVKDFAEFSNTKAKNMYDILYSASKNLRKKEIAIEKINDDGKKEFLVTGFFSSANYVEGAGTLKIKIDPDLKPYLLAINGKKTPFTKYMLKNILKLHSAYSIRIYELLKQYLTTRSRKFEMSELRSFLGIEDKYKRFSNFETYVLKVAKEEINQYTDIDINYEKIKKGRKITHIAFSIRPSVRDKETEMVEILCTDEEFKDMKEKMTLTDKKLNKKQIVEFLKIGLSKTEHLESVDVYDYIKINVEYTNEKTPDNYNAYLKKALQDDFSGAITVLKLLGKVK